MGLIGRTTELGLIVDALEQHHVVVLTGMSGVGKTAVARQFADDWSGPAHVLDCFGADVEEIAGLLRERLELAPGLSAAETRVLVNDRTSEELLVVLDDVAAATIEETLAFVRGLRIRFVVTSHATVTGAPLLPIRPWDVDDAYASCRQLFVETARLENLEFRSDDSEETVLREIVVRLHGFPLGIVLAARRAATTSLRSVRELLDRPHALVDPRQADRHRSIQDAVSLSWESLGAADRRRLFAMACFRRPVRIGTLREVLGEDDGEFYPAVGDLVRRGLVAPGDFVRPLELFAQAALDVYPKDQPAEAECIERAIVQRAVRLAEALPEGLTDHPDFTEEPSFWEFALQRAGDLSAADHAAVVAGWCR